MHNLSDELLIYAYQKALELGLSQEFIALLREEIDERNIFIKNED